MTSQADFSEGDWKLVLEGPTGAAMLVVTAQRGGSFVETLSIARAYSEARSRPGGSELVGSIVSAGPVVEHTRFHSTDEFRKACLAHLRCGLEVVAANATIDELDDYRQFILWLCERVAQAHREDSGGDRESSAEREALAEIHRELGLG